MTTSWAIELQEIASHIQDLENENRKLRKAIKRHEEYICVGEHGRYDLDLWEVLK